MVEEQKSSYRQIFKATSIFGGVQIYNILIGIIKTKVIAVLLGPSGVGVISLYTSVIQMLTQATGLGIDQSGVRDVAEAYGSNNLTHISRTLTTVRKIVWFTGLLGVVVCVVFSPLLSQYTFGNSDYTYSFILLSLVLLFTQLGNGQSMLLRGTRQIKKLAKASVLGATIGLFTSIPLYYFMGVEGIVPAFIISSIVVAFIFWYFAKSVPTESCDLTLKQAFNQGQVMMKLGVMLTVSAFCSSVVAYAIRAYISNQGGISDVGLFSAGFMIIETYVGMVFTAMATDFYPRLAAVNKSNMQLNLMTNNQAIISLLIVAPLIILFIVFAPYLLTILYSQKFVAITIMIQLAILGVLFRTGAWSMSFILLAKADNKSYLMSELIGMSFMFFIYIIGYYYWQLIGIGVAFIIANLFHLFICYIFTTGSSKFKFSKEYYFILMIQLFCTLMILCATFFMEGFLKILVYTVCITLSLLVSLRELDRRIDIREFLRHSTLKKNCK